MRKTKQIIMITILIVAMVGMVMVQPGKAVVKDVTAPNKPKIYMEQNSDYIIIKGEVGTDVYVKQISEYEKDGWRKLGTLTQKKEGFFLSISGFFSAHAGDYYAIRLVDDAGNKSEIVNTDKMTEDLAWEVMY